MKIKNMILGSILLTSYQAHAGQYCEAYCVTVSTMDSPETSYPEIRDQKKVRGPNPKSLIDQCSDDSPISKSLLLHDYRVVNLRTGGLTLIGDYLKNPVYATYANSCGDDKDKPLKD